MRRNAPGASESASTHWPILARFAPFHPWDFRNRRARMGFFAEFSTWLNGLLGTYVSEQTARVAAAIEPAMVILAAVYVMAWGACQAAGQIEEPLLEGLKRIGRIALVFGIGLHLWLYQELIVDAFFTAPNTLAA